MSPPALRFRQAPTTSTVTVMPSGKPRISARGVVAQRQQQLTAEQARDPAEVAKSIGLLQKDIAQSTKSMRNEPETGAIIFQGIPVSSGITFTLTHNFGRPFQGYRVTRTYFGAAAGITLCDGALPAGMTLATAVALIPSATGKIDIRVWG
jgi:hypothetical protein